MSQQITAVLTILLTLTVQQFKDKFKADELLLIKNPKTGKPFIGAVGVKGSLAAVSKNYNSSEPKEFIQCKWDDQPDDADPIWVLHNPNAECVVERF